MAEFPEELAENEVAEPLVEDVPETVGDEPPVVEEESEDTATGYPEEIEKAILTINEFYAKEDEGIRNMMLAFWKKLDNYFDGIQRIFWDFDATEWGRLDFENLDPTRYDKIINIYRAHGEAIIAALSIKLPNVIYYPEDADVSEDINTAKAYSKAAQLISNQNQSILLFIKALFILFNQGVVAAYIYNRSKNEYGEIEVPDYGKDITVRTHTLTCPICRGYLGEYEDKEPVETPDAPISDEQQETPGDLQILEGGSTGPMMEMGSEQEAAPTIPEVEETLQICPMCGAEIEPDDELVEETFPQITGYTKYPKSRTIIDVFGPTYVQMPFYARNQESMPYIRMRFEQHFSILKSTYPRISDRIPTKSDTQSYDREIRSYNNLEDAYSTNLVTTTCAWFRPWSFEVLNDPELILKMKEKFPNGCYAVILGTDLVAEAKDEKLDEHWAVSHNPMSHFIHADPLGKPLAPVQEIRNEINDLALETFEHAIPETFADPDVLDFDKYGQSQAQPGMKYPAKKPMGGALADAFYTDMPARMSEELKSYEQQIDQDGQFVVGSFPSIYGGPASGGSKTAKEYSESRAMALQRLNTTWTMLKYWWSNVMGKAVPLFLSALSDDEKFVEKKGDTSFINVWIRQAELTGKVGRVEPDVNEELPTSFAQYKAVLMELLTLGNDNLNQAIFAPQNTPNVAKVLGWPDFHIPGMDDRDKQYWEISQLLQGIDVQPEIGVDDDMVHIQTCRSWAVSPTGIATKQENPDGYMMVMQHAMLHMQNQQGLTEDDAVSPGGEPPPSNAETPVA